MFVPILRNSVDSLTTMTTDVEDCVKLLGSPNELLELLRILPKRLLLVQKVDRCLVVF